MEESEIKTRMNEKFIDLLNQTETKMNSALLTNDKYTKLIKDVKNAKEHGKKQPRDYWLLQHYDILVIGGIEKLIVPMKKSKFGVVFYVEKDELFDILYNTHLAVGHGGRDRMVKELNKNYKNITRGQIKLFLESCEGCKHKKKEGVKPSNMSQHLNNPLLGDLIDFESHPVGKFIYYIFL